ncbi:MAG TPA: GDP-mannose 4,6-dehydratase [Dongiaceae bacterium]|nr:GDP-mannose 4,6-dehydratase [Dongiaceae bacterium]
MSLGDLHVVVTGGGGFIGNEVTRQLLARGARVSVIDNFVNGKMENLADLDPARLNVARVDVRDLERVAPIFRDAQLVLHLACLGVRHSLHAPLENHDVNATATLRLLELARASGVRRFQYVSTSEVYGTARSAPMTEDHPTFPLTVYGASKLAGERYTDAYWQTWKYPTSIVRPFNAFGPRSHHEGDSGEVIPKFMLRGMAGLPLVIHGDGTQTRDFTFVSDTAGGIIEAALTDKTIGQTVNLGSGREVTILELSGLIGTVLGGRNVQVQHGPDRPGDVRRLIADSAKAKGLFGFQPQVSLRDGLALLRDWYQASGRSVEELLRDERSVNWTAPSA